MSTPFSPLSTFLLPVTFGGCDVGVAFAVASPESALGFFPPFALAGNSDALSSTRTYSLPSGVSVGVSASLAVLSYSSI